MILWNFLLLFAIQPPVRFLQAHFCVPASNTPNRFIAGAGKPIYSSCRRSNRYLPLLSRALWRYIMGKYSEFFHVLKVFLIRIWLVTAVGKTEDTPLRIRVTHTLLSTFLREWHTYFIFEHIFSNFYKKAKLWFWFLYVCELSVLFYYYFFIYYYFFFLWISFSPCDNREFKQWQRQRKRQNLKPLFDWLNEENNRATRATRTWVYFCDVNSQTAPWSSVPNSRSWFLTTMWTHNSISYFLSISFNGAPNSTPVTYFVNNRECEQGEVIAKSSHLRQMFIFK